MEKEIKRLNACQVEIKGELEWQEFQKYFERAIKDLSKDVQIKGFRPGKAPREMVERAISREKVIQQASKQAIRESYQNIIEAERFEPIGYPSAEVLKVAEKNPFQFRIRVDVLPEIKLPDLKDIARGIKKREVKAEEREVKDSLEWVRKSRANFKDLNKQASKGDFVRIEYQSPQVESNKLFKDSFILGQGHFIADFEKNLLGMKENERKEFKAEFPDDFPNKGLKGKEVSFKVKMNKVQLMEAPEMNDEFAKSLGQFKTVKDLEKSIEQGMEREKELQAKAEYREEFLEKILERTSLTVPESLLFLEKEQVLKEMKLNKDSLTREQQKELQEVAEKRVKNLLLLREIGKQAKIGVSKEEIEQAINSFFANYPQNITPQIDKQKIEEYYRGIIYNEKVFKVIDSYASNSNHN